MSVCVRVLCVLVLQCYVELSTDYRPAPTPHGTGFCGVKWTRPDGQLSKGEWQLG